MLMSSTQSSGRHMTELQPRDLLLLRGLFESRVMTLAQASLLYFGGKSEAAKKRLQKLKAAGLIRERPRKAYEPAVLFLTSRAFILLAEAGHLVDYPSVSLSALQKRAQVSDLTLRHELEVMEVKAALSSAIAALPAYSIVEFATWPLLIQFKAFRSSNSGYGKEEVLLKPDGLLRLHEQEQEEVYEHAFYLEVDRSTESQEVLAQKASCYINHYRSGGLALRHGGQRKDYQLYPFRVLMVFRNGERRNNTAERLLQVHPPIHTQVWLTTAEEIKQDPLGKIWMRPIDYRDATADTPFDTGRRRDSIGYRRQQEREEFVERLVPKQQLLINRV